MLAAFAQREGLRGHRYRDIGAVLPNLRRFFAIPSPSQNVVARRQIFGNEHLVLNGTHDPVAGTCAHAVAITPTERTAFVADFGWTRAVDHTDVPRARCRKLQTPWPRSSGGAGTSFRVGQAEVVVVDAWDGVPRPGGADGLDAGVNEHRLRLHRVRQRAVVPHQDLRRTIELQRRPLKAFFCELLVGRA